ncbi:hypothetical protein [Flavobacterium aquidurense]|uniref:hypothetical protein n=1 Tax=Flavobacterium aquidurense TaxID=362413 RepID=UPI00285B0403|nr:hypothetical protein [Flavobacterium aquidurense]MDR7371160.1 hypothetical protein [Flavobacterium aquidurense]
MKKLFLLLLFLMSTILFAQTKNKNLFCADSTITSFSFLKAAPSSSIDYKKLLNLTVAYSIYNPKPGFEPTKIKSQHYYSLANTNKLLKREMSNIEPEPIFPDQEKQKSFGQAIFEGVLDSLLD